MGLAGQLDAEKNSPVSGEGNGESQFVKEEDVFCFGHVQFEELRRHPRRGVGRHWVCGSGQGEQPVFRW